LELEAFRHLGRRHPRPGRRHRRPRRRLRCRLPDQGHRRRCHPPAVRARAGLPRRELHRLLQHHHHAVAAEPQHLPGHPLRAHGRVLLLQWLPLRRGLGGGGPAVDCAVARTGRRRPCCGAAAADWRRRPGLRRCGGGLAAAALARCGGKEIGGRNREKKRIRTS
ncbi:hypothetical protein BAE44_0004732, partial [Dichanthelium oligosanthes]